MENALTRFLFWNLAPRPDLFIGFTEQAQALFNIAANRSIILDRSISKQMVAAASELSPDHYYGKIDVSESIKMAVAAMQKDGLDSLPPITRDYTISLVEDAQVAVNWAENHITDPEFNRYDQQKFVGTKISKARTLISNLENKCQSFSMCAATSWFQTSDPELYKRTLKRGFVDSHPIFAQAVAKFKEELFPLIILGANPTAAEITALRATKSPALLEAAKRTTGNLRALIGFTAAAVLIGGALLYLNHRSSETKVS